MLKTDTADIFRPLTQPATFKAAFGGRGSGKSWFFAEELVKDSVKEPGNHGGEGLRSVCIRETQKDLTESSKRTVEDKIRLLAPNEKFTIYKDRIETPGDGVIIFRGMRDHTAEAIKSLEGYKRSWCEEAQNLSEVSLELLLPTIRYDGSEMWFSWNPRHKHDPVDIMFRQSALPFETKVVEANWSNNPWFPKNLEKQRLHDKANKPDRYDHIWEGGYVTVTKGAYYAACLTDARAQGRVAFVAPDPIMTYRAYWDIGSTGPKADACAIWIAQFIGSEIRILNYYEAVGQPPAVHINWLRDNGYGRALCVLPHDGSTHDRTVDATYESTLKAAGFDVKVIPNQGKGAAMLRINRARRLFPSMRFNESTCEAGLLALGAYHEKKNTVTMVGLGPHHGPESNGADSFGMMAIDYEPPRPARKPNYAKMDRHVI